MIWGQFGFQNAANTIIECIIYFHDYIILILRIILIFVVYILLALIRSNYLDKETLESHILETIWTIIPIIILLFIAYPSLIILYFMEASENDVFTYNLKAIAHQWYWEYETTNISTNSIQIDQFRYYKMNLRNISFDRAILVNPKVFYTLEATEALVVPLNTIIVIYVTSADVLHAFTVPSFGIKVDAIPGRINTLTFNVRLAGIYYGQCSEICGANHRFIPIRVYAK